MDTTWQTVYEQLQEFLNECIELWWKPYWRDNIEKFVYRKYLDYNAQFRMIKKWDPWEVSYVVWVHDILSMWSLLVEFVNRNIQHEWYLTVHEHWWFMYDIKSQTDIAYAIMWNMIEEEKVQYFLANAKLPTKSE